MHFKPKRTASELTFYPYAAQWFLAFFDIIGAVLMPWFIKFTSDFWGKALFAAVTFIFLLLAVYMILLAPMCITVSCDEILIYNPIRRKTFRAEWKQFAAAYRMHDLKGNCLLLFSVRLLDQNEQKKGLKMANLNGNVCIQVNQYFDEIKALIEGKIAIIQ